MSIRKIEMQYDRNDFVNLIFLIQNIVIGLKSLEVYEKYINNKLLEEITTDLGLLESSIDKLFGLFKPYCDDVILTEQNYLWLKSLFAIEEKYKPLVSWIWSRELTNINNFNDQKDYKLLVHYIEDEQYLFRVKSHFDKPSVKYISTSLITPQRQDNIWGNGSHYGFVFSLESFKFLGANDDDGGTYKSTKHDYTTIMQEDENNINSSRHVLYHQYYFTTMTKTPESLINPIDIPNKYRNSNFNEVTLLKGNFEPIAVAQFYYGKPFISLYYEKVKDLATFFNVPVIYINRANISRMEDFINHPYKKAIIMSMNKLSGVENWQKTNQQSDYEYYNQYIKSLV